MTPSILAISRSSRGVTLAYAGPRRPSTDTTRATFAAKPSRTCSGISVASNCSGVRTNMRATSNATLPTPTTAARSAVSGNSGCTSGWPSYQVTNSAAPNEPARFSPGIPMVRSVSAPVANTTAWYIRRMSSSVRSVPNSTLPIKRMRGSCAIPSKVRAMPLMRG